MVSAIAALQLLLPRLGTMFKDTVGGDAESILDGKELAELIEHGQGKTGIAAQSDLHAGKGGLQSRHQAQQHGHDTGMTGCVSRTQPCCQQTSAVALEDEHGVIHVLAVGSVEEAELLLAVRGIIGGIEVEQNLAALPDLIAAETDELLAPGVVEAHQIASRGRVLPAAERGLRAQSLTQFLIGDDLQQGIMTQTVGIVGVFVSGHDLRIALTQTVNIAKTCGKWRIDSARAPQNREENQWITTKERAEAAHR